MFAPLVVLFAGDALRTDAAIIKQAGRHLIIGETDDFSYNIVKDPVHIHDLNATLMQQLGINHEAFTYRSQGRDYRLTDVHGHVMKDMLA